jgi:hypothetical protein
MPFRVAAWTCGESPVTIEHIAGPVNGSGVQARSKRSPFDISRSILGEVGFE